MAANVALTIVMLIVFPVSLALGVYLLILIIRALRKYVGSESVRKEKKCVAVTLGECLRENRIRCKMTQEFTADTLGVSRQAVSKWENGTSDPSTTNLLALAKLYGISAEELLRQCSESDS